MLFARQHALAGGDAEANKELDECTVTPPPASAPLPLRAPPLYPPRDLRTTVYQVRDDIQRQLDMKNPRVLMESFNRPNIRLTVRYKVLLSRLRWSRVFADMHGSLQRTVMEP